MVSSTPFALRHTKHDRHDDDLKLVKKYLNKFRFIQTKPLNKNLLPGRDSAI